MENRKRRKIVPMDESSTTSEVNNPQGENVAGDTDPVASFDPPADIKPDLPGQSQPEESVSSDDQQPKDKTNKGQHDEDLEQESDSATHPTNSSTDNSSGQQTQKQKRNQTKRLQECREQVKKLQEENCSLKAEFRRIKDNCSFRYGAEMSAEQFIRSLNNEYEVVSKERDDLKQRFEKIDKKHSEQLKAAKEVNMDTIQSLKKQVEDISEQRDAQTTRSKSLLESCNRLEDDLDKLNKQSNALSGKLSKSENELSIKKTELKSLKEESKKQKNEHDEERRKLKNNIQSLVLDNKKLKECNSRLKCFEDVYPKLTEEIDRYKNEIQRMRPYEETYPALQRELRNCELQLKQSRDTNQGLSRENSSLEEEKKSLLLRLSKLAGANLTYNNPNIADLSDDKRPTKLAEEFSELYDNEWTDAFEEVDIQDEKLKTTFMLELLQRANQLCHDVSTKHKQDIQRSFSTLTVSMLLPKLPNEELNEESVPEETNQEPVQSSEDKAEGNGELQQNDGKEVSLKSDTMAGDFQRHKGNIDETSEDENESKTLIKTDRENKSQKDEMSKDEKDRMSESEEDRQSKDRKDETRIGETDGTAIINEETTYNENNENFESKKEGTHEDEYKGTNKTDEKTTGKTDETNEGETNVNTQGEVERTPDNEKDGLTGKEDDTQDNGGKDKTCRHEKEEESKKENRTELRDDKDGAVQFNKNTMTKHAESEATIIKEDVTSKGDQDGRVIDEPHATQGDQDGTVTNGKDEKIRSKKVEVGNDSSMIAREEIDARETQDDMGSYEVASPSLQAKETESTKVVTEMCDGGSPSSQVNETESTKDPEVRNESNVTGVEQEDDGEMSVTKTVEGQSQKVLCNEEVEVGDTKPNEEETFKEKFEEPKFETWVLESDFQLLRKEQMKIIMDARKFFEQQLSEEVEKAATDIIVKERGIEAQELKTVVAYVQKCINICWSMCRHDPPVQIEFLDVTGNVPFDTNKFKPYTRSGKFIDYIVWPNMYLHEGGPLLCKGVAQGRKE